MSKMVSGAPLLVVVGPTASGKSAVAMRVAEEYSGEIICSDSRTLYKGMDIGTAKPAREDRARVPHWGLDLVEPGERFTAADFKDYANTKIEEIRARGNLPIMVGGTGLYNDAVLFDFSFAKTDPKLRAELETLSLDDLKLYCANNNISLPENHQNRRYVLRAIERHEAGVRTATPYSDPPENAIVVGISTNPDELKRRIQGRADELFALGMVNEAKKLGETYGWGSEAMTGNVYPLVKKYVDGEYSEAELRERFVIADWQLAKRQRTYLKRNPYIEWVEREHAYNYICSRLTPFVV